MTCLSTKDGYAIYPDLKRNKIVINLPQTLNTATNTMWPVEDRKDDLSDAEWAIILQFVRSIFVIERDRHASKE